MNSSQWEILFNFINLREFSLQAGTYMYTHTHPCLQLTPSLLLYLHYCYNSSLFPGPPSPAPVKWEALTCSGNVIPWRQSQSALKDACYLPEYCLEFPLPPKGTGVTSVANRSYFVTGCSVGLFDTFTSQPPWTQPVSTRTSGQTFL